MKKRLLNIPKEINDQLGKLVGHLGNKSMNDVLISAAKIYLDKHKEYLEEIETPTDNPDTHQ